MKRLFTIACLAALLSGCSKNASEPSEQGYGSVELQCSPSSLVDAVTKTQTDIAPKITVPAASAFALHISGTGSLGTVSDLSYTTLADYDTPQLENGTYTAEASYGSATAEGADKPYFYGTASFTVIARKKTAETIATTIRNAAMTLTTTEWFDNYYSSPSFTITTTAGNAFTFTGAATDPVIFVQAGTKLSFSGSATKQTGVKVTWNATDLIGTTVANTFYTIRVDAPQAGAGALSVTFSEEPVHVESHEVDLGD